MCPGAAAAQGRPAGWGGGTHARGEGLLPPLPWAAGSPHPRVAVAGVGAPVVFSGLDPASGAEHRGIGQPPPPPPDGGEHDSHGAPPEAREPPPSRAGDLGSPHQAPPRGAVARDRMQQGPEGGNNLEAATVHGQGRGCTPQRHSRAVTHSSSLCRLLQPGAAILDERGRAPWWLSPQGTDASESQPRPEGLPKVPKIC